MEKLKLKIKGMHCSSCSSLIESELKDKNGIIMPKVNHESGKAVIIFDRDKISEEEIIKEIENAGDYKVEKIKEDSSSNSRPEEAEKETNENDNIFFANHMWLGFLAGVGSLSIIINVILVAYLFVA